MDVEDAVLSITSQHHATRQHQTRATAQWLVSDRTVIDLHKKERLTLYSSTFQIENYLKTSAHKRWQLFFCLTDKFVA